MCNKHWTKLQQNIYSGLIVKDYLSLDTYVFSLESLNNIYPFLIKKKKKPHEEAESNTTIVTKIKTK